MTTHKPLSSRVQEIRPSGIRKIFDLACQYPDGLDLSIGNPDFDVPEPIKNEAIFQIKNGFNQYVSTRGIDELRQVIIKDLTSRKINFEDILITAGITGALYLTMLAIISPGDEVYDRFVYSGLPFVSMGNIAPDAIVISGFSKSTGMTGWQPGLCFRHKRDY